MAVVMVRKNTSVKSGRVRKGKFTPPSATRLDVIIEEIVTHLGPWKRGLTEAEVSAGVKYELDVLLKLASLEAQLPDRNQNRIHARKLDNALVEVERLLASAPSMLVWYLFSPLPMTADEQAMRASIDDIDRAYRKRADAFFDEAKRLRKICARAIDPGYGSHPNSDSANQCLVCSWPYAGVLEKQNHWDKGCPIPDHR
jgi:hypothetical protein